MHCKNDFSTFQDVNLWIVEQGSIYSSREAPLIILDSKSDMCMAKNGKDTKQKRHIERRLHSVRNE